MSILSISIPQIQSHYLYNIGIIPCGSAGKESACSMGDLGSIPGLGRSSGEGKGYPFQYSCLENSMDCIVHGVTKNRTRLSDFRCLSYNNVTYITYIAYNKGEQRFVQ